jgi:hypothetical protein
MNEAVIFNAIPYNSLKARRAISAGRLCFSLLIEMYRVMTMMMSAYPHCEIMYIVGYASKGFMG